MRLLKISELEEKGIPYSRAHIYRTSPCDRLHPAKLMGKRMFASHVKWEAEPVDMTADAAMAVGGGEGEGKLEAAEEFIKEVLTPGEHVSVTEFNKQAEALGISKRTLKRARAKLGVKALKGDFSGGWALYLLQVVK